MSVKAILTEQRKGSGLDIVPGDVTNLKLIGSGNGNAYITWTDPTDVTVGGTTLLAWGGTRVVYKKNSAPSNAGDGTMFLDSRTRNTYSTNPLKITGLEIGATYYIKLFPYSTTGTFNEKAGVNQVSCSVSTIAPATFSLASPAAGHQTVWLTWTDPPTTDFPSSTVHSSEFSKTELYRSTNSDMSGQTLLATLTTINQHNTNAKAYKVTGLTNGTKYYFRAVNYNKDNKTSQTAILTATPNDVYLGNATSISCTESNGKLVIKWTDPNDVVTNSITTAKWKGTRLVRKTGSYPTSPTDGTVVINSTSKNAYSSSGYTDSGATGGTYYYQLFPYTTDDIFTNNTANRTSGTVWTWPGWSSASWADVHTLCQKKQSGSISAALSTYSGVAIGATKDVTLSSAVLGSKTVTMEIIGIEIDGTGTITLQSKNCLANATVFSSADAIWKNSTTTARTECQNFYNRCNIKSYIKTVSKGTYSGTPDSTQNKTNTEYNNETVWIPSHCEVNLAGTAGYSMCSAGEYTKNVSKPYPKYTNNASRVKNRGSSADSWWCRSRYYNNSSHVCNVYSSGARDHWYYTYSIGLAPACVFG